MIPKPIGEPDMALAGLVLLIFFGFMIWHDRPIQSSRPYDATSNQLQDQRNITDGQYESWLWEDPFAFNPGEDRVYKKLHGIFQLNNTNPISSNEDYLFSSTGVNNLCYCNNGRLAEKIVEIANKKKEAQLQILVSPVIIGPNTVENRELRTRHRYAVIAGLIESGFIPVEPNKLHFCYSQHIAGERKYDVRWEYFTKEKENIIIVWSDSKSAEFNRKRIINSVLRNENDADIFILDSTKSEVFKSIWPIIPQNKPNDIPTSTSPLPHEINIVPSGSEALLNKLYIELKSRRITNPSEVVIISEHDTESVRDFAANFRASSFCEVIFKEDEDKAKFNECETREIKNISYLKGLDAYQQIIGIKDQNVNSRAAKDEQLSVIDQRNLPSGSGQFDYLYRLAEEIKKSHKDLDPNKRINAVGIFGSDFHDKLIIFRALRSEIPNILLFTTELDAEMYHPQHWRWTRNLVVASHFDLQLNERLQKQIPPFRDSQQTKIYYSILKGFGGIPGAQHPQSKAFGGEQKPLIFEIGRNGPVRLALDEKDVNYPGQIKIDPDENDLYELNTKIIFWTLIIICLIFTVQQIKPNSGLLVLWLSTTAIIFFAIIFYAANQKTGDPLSFTDGISVWPSILIRLLTLSLAMAFIFKTICTLEANFFRLTRRNFDELATEEISPQLTTLVTDNSPISERELFNMPSSNLKLDKSRILGSILFIIAGIAIYTYAIGNDPVYMAPMFVLLIILFAWLLILPNCPGGIVRVFIVLIIPITFIVTTILVITILPYLLEEQFESLKIVSKVLSFVNLEQLWLSVMTLLVTILFTIIYGEEIIKSIQIWIQKDSIWDSGLRSKNISYISPKEPRPMISMVSLWREYRLHGLPEHRLERATIKFLLFLVIASFLYHLFPTSSSPCRGATCQWEEVVHVISFSVIIFLTFLVLDAQRLCLHWIEKIRTKHPLFVDSIIQTSNHEDFLLREANERRDNYPFGSLKNIVSLVAKRTHVVDRLIYYPLIAIMLMLFARINYIDNMDFPHSIGIVFVTSIFLLLFSGLKLRSEANKLRLAVINSIYNLSNQSGDQKDMIKEVAEINYGAFEPLLEQPAMRALLLTLASLGVFAGEYIMIFW